MVPEWLPGEWRIRLCRISDEASGRVGIQCQKKRYKQVMSVPERLVRLLTDFLVRSRVYEKHTEKHDVSGDATCLLVMDLDRGFRSDL